MNKNFVGFHTLEKLLDAANCESPLDAMPIVHPGKGGKYGIAINTQLIQVSQVQPNGEVLYCRIIVGRYQALAGSHESLGGENYSERSQSAWQIVREEISKHGFHLREAVVAFPLNLRFLDGSADCLKYNKDTGLYEQRDAASVEV